MSATKRMVLLSGGAVALALALVAPGAGAGSGDRRPGNLQPTHVATVTCHKKDAGTINPGTIYLSTNPDAGFTLNFANCVAGWVRFWAFDGDAGTPFEQVRYWYDAGVGPLLMTQPNPTPAGRYKIWFQGATVNQKPGAKNLQCPNCGDDAPPGDIIVSTSGNNP